MRACGRRHGLVEEGRRALPRPRLAVERDRVLEIDDQGVGAARHRLVEHFRAVGGDEEEGAHHASIVPSVTMIAGPPTLADESAPSRMVTQSSTQTFATAHLKSLLGHEKLVAVAERQRLGAKPRERCGGRAGGRIFRYTGARREHAGVEAVGRILGLFGENEGKRAAAALKRLVREAYLASNPPSSSDTFNR